MPCRPRLKEHVIDEPGPSDPHREGKQGRSGDLSNRNEPPGITEKDVPDPDTGPGEKKSLHGKGDPTAGPLPGCTQTPGQFQGLEEALGGPAFPGIEIGIPRTHSQAVRLSHSGMAHDLNREVEVHRHAPYDLELLEVLLSEQSCVRLYYIEKLGDHRGHPLEMAGPRSSAEPEAQFPDVDPGLMAFGIHRVHRRDKETVHPRGRGHTAVAVVIRRIPLQVFRRTELRRIHEKAHHNPPGVASRGLHQGEVTLMKIPHGGHQGDGFPHGLTPPAPCPHFRDCTHNIHDDPPLTPRLGVV